VSALTNNGVQEAFRTLITDIHSCNILHKELLDLERKLDDSPGGASSSGNDDRKSIVLNGKRGASRGKQSGGGGMLSMIPFLGCASARDDKMS
jgi:hypothetical protein